MLQHPFYHRQVPIVLGDHVTLEAGTGAVHTAPGHGLEDYIVGQRYGLPVDNPVGGNGCFLPGTPLFEGEHVFKANEHVIDVLVEHGALMKVSRFTHSYPVCWRHKSPIIFRATPQWFISMQQKGLRDTAMAEIQRVELTPTGGRRGSRAWSRTARTGVSHASAPGACRSPSLCTKSPANCIPDTARTGGAGGAARRAARYPGLVRPRAR